MLGRDVHQKSIHAAGGPGGGTRRRQDLDIAINAASKLLKRGGKMCISCGCGVPDERRGAAGEQSADDNEGMLMRDSNNITWSEHGMDCLAG